MRNRDKYTCAVVNSNSLNRLTSSDFVFQFAVDFNSFVKSADLNIKSNKGLVSVSLGVFVLGLFLVSFLL